LARLDEQEPLSPRVPVAAMRIDNDVDYWMVGVYWEDRDPQDQTDRFLAEGIWKMRTPADP
jgi:hypothetical protein